MNETVRAKTAPPGWQFAGGDASFILPAPDRTSYLYFPLVNEAGMMSVVTPTLHGDAKTGQNTFLTLPVSVEDLHNTRSARNFWVTIGASTGGDPRAWSATGNSAWQLAEPDADVVTLEAGLLWHKVTRKNQALGLIAEVLSFVPAGPDPVEVMRVTLRNDGAAALTLTPTAAIPIYGRSADNLRDHRHVTSLLHRIRTVRHGVAVRPTLSFDERGHQPNQVTYAILGAGEEGAPPSAFFPDVESFCGEGANFERPAAVLDVTLAGVPEGYTLDGFEAMGALRFETLTLQPGQARTYILILAVLGEDGDDAALQALVQTYGSTTHVENWLQRTREFWQARTRPVSFTTGDPRFDKWMQWVTIQPTLRRLFGNSFLPFHDYGRGGRGWRDLWQDCLALLLLEPEPVRDLLLSSFAGVRIDGSNATIIGAKPGEFKADRNNIPRVWMDHGAWPYLTTRLYIDQSGDLAFLLQGQSYFKDRHVDRCRAQDAAWTADQGTQLLTAAGAVYRGTVLEHLLVQHLTAFFNVGAAGNNILLEGADWNDGMDMARVAGESVAFTALYAANLADLAALVLALAQLGVSEVELAAEMPWLLDTLRDPVDYEDAAAKQRRLAHYFAQCRHTVDGATVRIALADVANDLRTKATWLAEHVRRQEWVRDGSGHGWFNGYYDDAGQRVEGQGARGVRMTLTGQVFTLLSGIATDEQAAAIIQAADHYLYDRGVGGYRLNTDFGEVLLNLGRCFGFAFGHKENGAMFSHMAVMYAYALYRRGFVEEGFQVLEGIYRHCQDFAVAAMYPGLPEYVNERGRGVYPWLTGSASWYLLTLLTEAFGVRGHLGDLVLDPKLMIGQFDAQDEATVGTQFADRQLAIVYRNPQRLAAAAAQVQDVTIDGEVCATEREGRTVRLRRSMIESLAPTLPHRLVVTLGPI